MSALLDQIGAEDYALFTPLGTENRKRIRIAPSATPRSGEKPRAPTVEVAQAEAA